MISRKDEKWLADIQPGGRGCKRYRKSFERKADALAWVRRMEAKKVEEPGWEPVRPDRRRLSELVALWESNHGLTLKTCKERVRALSQFVGEIGDPPAFRFSGKVFLDWRKGKLEEGLTP